MFNKFVIIYTSDYFDPIIKSTYSKLRSRNDSMTRNVDFEHTAVGIGKILR